MLESTGSIVKTKGHNSIFIKSITTAERRFPFFSWSHPEAMVSLWHIEFSEEFRFADSAEDFTNEGKGVTVHDSDLIEAPIIDA